MKKKLALLLAVVMLVGMIPVPGFAAEEAPVWDLLDCTMDNWEANWNKTVKAGQIQAEVTQENGYVNINKGDDKTNNPGAGVSAYTWLVPKTAPALPSGGKFTLEVTARSAGPVTSEKHGEISVRMGTGSNDQNGKLYPMFLKHGVEDGYIATQAKGENGYTLNTTVWHNYGLVVDVDTKTMDLYVDGELVIPGASALTYKGGNLLRIGVDNNARCNMDILAARMGTGDLSAELSAYEAPAGETPAITAVTLSGDSQVELTETQVEVTVDTVFIADGETVTAQLVNAQHEAVEGVAASGTVTGNQAKITLTIPATVAMGEYAVKASWQEKTAYSGSYTVKSALKAPVFPTFAAEGFTIEMPDYGYNPTDEFNFPTIVDTRDHPVSNELGDYRYYLFYAPHDAPAGNCVAASNSLDGPWVEYEGNPVVARSWEGNYSVSHVSSPFVMWLEEQNCYIMYFHGENPVTRYATSTDLLHWTYGGECVNAKDFREDGGEASYARVFRHEVPGLGNKYIMLLMISPTGGFSDKNRDICWAHSANGTDWTVVKEPLLDPTWNDVYQGNFSGPFFMPWEVDGEMRYFVICHASTGEMYTFEVGEKLDQYIEWGEFYNSIGIRNVDDLNPDCYPDYGRSGAPYFIQDDNGRWHMFYEAGKRLNTNIVHAVEVRSGEEDRLARAGLEVDNSALQPALTGKLALRVFDKSNRAVDLAGLTVTYHVSDETVISCDSGVIAALDEGTATVWAEVTRGEETILSEKVEITVTVPGKEIMVSNAQTPNKTALNLELPAPFKAADFLTNPIDNYYLYFSYNDESGGTRSIALATAPAPEGPWTVYNEGTPVMTKESLGVSGEVNAPWPIWDGANNRMLMYYSIGANTICVAESTDGVNFTNIGVVLTQDRLDNSSNAYQQSVYEYTIPGKNNKYLMLFTGNGYASGNVKNGKRLFYAWSDDGLNWTVEQEPLHSPSAPDSGDKGNVASPRLADSGRRDLPDLSQLRRKHRPGQAGRELPGRRDQPLLCRSRR